MARREPLQLLAAAVAAAFVAAVLWVGTEFAVGVVAFCVYGKDEVPQLVATLATVAPWLVALAGGIAAGRSAFGAAGAAADGHPGGGA